MKTAICLILLVTLPQFRADTDSDQEKSSKYEPDIAEDYSNVDKVINEAFQYLYDTVVLGYDTLKVESEEELKRAVTWVEDYYENVTSQYEDALYDFEQTYIQNSNSNSADYEFVFDIEALVYDNLDDFEQSCKDAEENMEDLYWDIVDDLGNQQEDVESYVENAQEHTDDVMDITEETLNDYVEDLNEKRWNVQEAAQDISDDIDDDMTDYYEDDEDSFDQSEMAAASDLINEISDAEDFDSLSSSDSENEIRIQEIDDYLEDTLFIERKIYKRIQ